MGLLRRLIHLERRVMAQQTEIGRKNQEIMALIDDNAELMRRYRNLLDQCVLAEAI